MVTRVTDLANNRLIQSLIFNAQDTGHADYPMMAFQTGGTERMRITPDGKLFIGDNSFGGTAARFAVEVPASGAGSLIKVDSVLIAISINNRTVTK